MTPFGHLPVLECDGNQLGESFAINRYLARQFGELLSMITLSLEYTILTVHTNSYFAKIILLKRELVNHFLLLKCFKCYGNLVNICSLLILLAF